MASSRRLHGVQEKLRTPRCAQWDLLERRGIAVASPWHLHWTPWGPLGRHATARTLCMHKVRAVARRSHGDLNERRVNAVGSQRQRSNSAVRSPRAPRGRRAHAVGTHMIAARTPPFTTIIRECNEGIKKKHWQISEFQFPKPYFEPFCSVKYRNQANTTYFSVVVCLRCLLHHILSLITYTFRENRDFVFIIIVQFMMSSNIIRLFVHNTISLSSLCKRIWRHWTYKMPVRYILSSVWVSLSTFSQLSIIQYMGMCVFSLPISLVMIEIIYTLSYYHHQIGSMNYYPLFRARSWNNGMRCISIFLLYYFWDYQHHCCNMSIFSGIRNNYIN